MTSTQFLQTRCLQPSARGLHGKSAKSLQRTLCNEVVDLKVDQLYGRDIGLQTVITRVTVTCT